MAVTFLGNPVTLEGSALKVGDKMPDFILTDNDLNPVTLKDFSGIKVFVVVPSLDTGVCDLEVKNFNKKATDLGNITICAVSLDLPFSQGRWCGANGIEHVRTLSDYKDRNFGKATGTFMKELALLARSVFVVDDNNVVVHVEYVPEVTTHPDYETIYAKLKTLV